MTEKWVNAVKEKARIIQGQILATQLLIQEYGGDSAKATEHDFERLFELYRQELPLAELLDTSDLLAHYEGKAVTTGTPAMTFFSSKMKDMGTSLKRVVESIIDLEDSEELVKWSDLYPQLSGIVKGSLMVGVNVPTLQHEHEQRVLPDIPEPIMQIYQSVHDTVCGLSKVAYYIGDEEVNDGLLEEFPDPAIRDTVLVAAHSLAPRKSKNVTSLTLISSSQHNMQPKPLTNSCRHTLEHSIEKPIKKSKEGTFEGIVRAIDLDAARFEIRKVQGIGSIRCIYDKTKTDNARDLIDAKLRVTGNYEESKDGKPRLMTVDDIKVIKKPDKQQELYD